MERYKAKFGAARAESMIPYMQNVFKEEGIEINCSCSSAIDA